MADFNELANTFTAIGCLRDKMKRNGGVSRFQDIVEVVEEAFDRLDKSVVENVRDMEMLLQREVTSELEARKFRRALSAQAQDAMTQRFQNHPNANPNEILLSFLSLNRNGSVRGTSVETDAAAIAAQARAFMADFLEQHRDKVFGSDQDFSDVARAVFRENASERGKLIAEGVNETLEFIRKEANRYGMRIDKLDKFLPQTHDNAKVRGTNSTESKLRWVNFVKGRLNRVRMKSWKSGEQMNQAELDDLLDKMWERISNNELNEIQASNGLAKRNYMRRIEAERILHFKDSTAWLEYQREFGKWGGNLFDNLGGYIEGLSKDIAMVKHFGPNPLAGVAHAHKEARELARRQGKFSIVDSPTLPSRFKDIYNEMSGDAHMVENATIANVGASVRNAVIAANMGTSFFMALSDIAFSGAASKMAGLSATSTIGRMLSEFASTPTRGNRKIMLQTGYVADVWSHRAGAEHRYLGEISGNQMSRWAADRVLRTSFLQPWTEAGKVAFSYEFVGHLTRLRSKNWSSVPGQTRKMMERYGMNEGDWDVWRATTPWKADNGAEFIRPQDVISGDADETLARQAAGKVQAMILSEQDLAVPHPGARERSLLRFGQRKGTLRGELALTVTQLKSFPVTMMSILIQRMVMDRITTFPERFIPMAWFFVGSTGIAALGMQAGEISKGRTPRDPEMPKFWADAAIRGGAFGIFGDMMYQTANRGSQGFSDMLLGPLLPDLISLAAELPKLADDRNFRAREALNFVNNFVPGRSLWFSALAYERAVNDTIVDLLDEDAYAYFRNRRKYAREQGSEYWAPPGEGFLDSLEEIMQ